MKNLSLKGRWNSSVLEEKYLSFLFCKVHENSEK